MTETAHDLSSDTHKTYTYTDARTGIELDLTRREVFSAYWRGRFDGLQLSAAFLESASYSREFDALVLECGASSHDRIIALHGTVDGVHTTADID